MTYIQGFVAAVHKDRKAEYLAHAKETADIFIEFGATRCVENWADEFDLKYRRVDGYSIKARLKEARERASARAR